MSIICDNVGKIQPFFSKCDEIFFFCYFPKCKETDEVKFMSSEYINMPGSRLLESSTQRIFINLFFLFIAIA